METGNLALTKDRSMAMARYIEANIESIASECAHEIGHYPKHTGGLSERAQRLRLGRSLRAIAAEMALRRRDTGTTARGRRRDEALQLRTTAEEHAEHVYARGFTLEEMVAEYRALRGIVMRRWIECAPTLDREAHGELLSFNEAVDDSLTAAVLGFQERIDRTRDVFAAVVAHDLRAPLGVVLASAELVLSDAEPESHAAAAKRVRDAALQMRRIVGDLLDLARARIGATLGIRKAPMDLSDLCRRVAENVVAASPGAGVDVDCAGDLTGHWDAGRLEQMLTNVVTNAVQYGRREARVSVAARDEGQRVVLKIHNEGRPIPFHVRRAMRNPVEVRGRGPGPERRGGQGLGLGLFIARSIARAHGGDVEIESQAAHGTTVTIGLPRDGGKGGGRDA